MIPGKQHPAYAKVAFELRVGKKLEYEIPEELRGHLRVGTKVRVPLGRKAQVGYIAEFVEKPSFSPLKKIIGLVQSKLEIPDNVMELARWMANYYSTDVGTTLTSVVPAAVRKDTAKFKYISVIRRKATKEVIITECRKLQTRARKQAQILEHMLGVTGDIPLSDLCELTGAGAPSVRKLVEAGLLAEERVKQVRDFFSGEEFLATEPKTLTEDQKAVYEKIVGDVEKEDHAVHLIHGVTSSGKTEIYLQVIRRVLDLGRTAIVLVPEISLTPQTVERFRSRFGNTVSALHHRLSDGERHDEWHKLLQGESRIAIGARSAVFAPLQDLGLIVVDEEHEHSYKQTDLVPTYNARDIAVVRSKMENAVVILGSATPSMESYYNAMKGKYLLSELNRRIDDRPLPEMKVVDMTKGGTGGGTVLSDVMVNAIEKRLDQGEQVILFLNRRGYATIVMCPGCGEVITCTQCSVPMKYHKGENRLLCHMCGYTTRVPSVCPACKADTVKQQGFGTEKVERMLHAKFPEAQVLRMDFDTTRKKRSHDEILREFKSGKADILVGTQMIAKGLHFPNVTLVGIVNADTSLYMQDFRAAENTFQLITQVSGRAGRGEINGEVIIQTSMPDHFAIKAACHHSYREFFDREIESRRLFNYPPILRMVAVTVRAKKPEAARDSANAIVKESTEEPHPGIEILGPVEAPVKKAKGDFRYQIFLKSTRVSAMTHLVASLLQRVKLPSAVRVSADVDPVDMF